MTTAAKTFSNDCGCGANLPYRAGQCGQSIVCPTCGAELVAPPYSSFLSEPPEVRGSSSELPSGSGHQSKWPRFCTRELLLWYALGVLLVMQVAPTLRENWSSSGFGPGIDRSWAASDVGALYEIHGNNVRYGFRAEFPELANSSELTIGTTYWLVAEDGRQRALAAVSGIPLERSMRVLAFGFDSADEWFGAFRSKPCRIALDFEIYEGEKDEGGRLLGKWSVLSEPIALP